MKQFDNSPKFKSFIVVALIVLWSLVFSTFKNKQCDVDQLLLHKYQKNECINSLESRHGLTQAVELCEEIIRW